MIQFENGTSIENYGGIIAGKRNIRGAARESLEIIIRDTDYETVSSLFVDGAKLSIVEPAPQEGYDPAVYDKSEYDIAGDIIDKRDGSFHVFMCMKTENEIMEETLAETILMIGGM